VHGVFAAQVTQLPPLHTWFVPQVEPSLAFPDVMHTDAPVAQDVFPALQVVLLGVQS
jgi:hypothetical protein